MTCGSPRSTSWDIWNPEEWVRWQLLSCSLLKTNAKNVLDSKSGKSVFMLSKIYLYSEKPTETQQWRGRWYLVSLHLSLLIHKMGLIIDPTSLTCEVYTPIEHLLLPVEGSQYSINVSCYHIWGELHNDNPKHLLCFSFHIGYLTWGESEIKMVDWLYQQITAL